jgi:inosine/xanthosine triphosphatase
MRIGVGSTNRLKIEAVSEVFGRAFGSVTVVPVDAKSGVPSQPFEAQILEGATNRAKAALEGNDLGVGIEAGIVRMAGRLFGMGYCVITDGKISSLGSQPMFELPEVFHERLEKGVELGKVTDEFFRTENAKEAMGASGLLSKNLVNRKELLKMSISTALMPWVSREIYGRKK